MNVEIPDGPFCLIYERDDKSVIRSNIGDYVALAKFFHEIAYMLDHRIGIKDGHPSGG